VLLALLAMWYLYFLIFSRPKSSPAWGRKKKVVAILRRYDGIRRNHNQRIAEMLGEIELLFYSDTVVDYRKMLYSLLKIKNAQSQIGINKTDIVSQIEILCDEIQSNHKYMNVAFGSAQLFQKIEDALDKSSLPDVREYLPLLYTQSSAVEDGLKRKGKKEFWIGTVLGILSLALSIFSLLSNKGWRSL
jgi:hypothetical protein